MIDLFCFGEVLWDVYGEKRCIGGAPFNVCATANSIGLNSLLVTAVGDDESGRELVAEMEKRGVLSICQKNTNPTGVVKVTLDADKQPFFDIKKPVAYDFIELSDQAEEAAKDAQAFYFGSLAQRSEVSRQTLARLLDVTEGVVFYDVNLRKSIDDSADIVRKSLVKTDVLKVNDDELEVVQKLLDIEGGEQAFADILFSEFSLQRLFITRGANGASLFVSDGAVYHCKPPVIDVVDTTGCGDAFMAGVISATLKDLSDDEILESAVEMASRTALFRGAVSE